MLRRCVGKFRLKTISDLSHVKEYWPKAISWYEKYYSKFTIKPYKTVLPFLDMPNARKIIELGGGIGIGANVILPHLHESASYTLTNHVEDLNDLALAKQFPRVQAIKVDPSNLPFPGESFDRFIAMATLEELKNASDVIREAYRVLEPGGIMVASIMGKKEMHSLGMIYKKIRDLNRLNHPVNFQQNLGNVGAVKNLFKTAGFARTFAFYEWVHYDSMDVEKVKEVFLEEPLIKEAILSGKFIDVEKSVCKELKRIFSEEETPLTSEYLLIVAHKAK